MKQAKRIVLIVFILIIVLFMNIKVIAKQSEDVNYLNIKEYIEKISSQEQEVLSKINEIRKQEGLAELIIDNSLMEVAKIKAEDLLASEYFSHESLKYGYTFEIMKENKIDYTVAGENLGKCMSSEKVIELWMNSLTHKENILYNKYVYTGISVIESTEGNYIFVQLFMY